MGLEIVELTLEIEQRFGIEIPDSSLESLRTVGDWYVLLRRLLPGPDAKGEGPSPSGRGTVGDCDLWRHLQSMVAGIASVPCERVSPETRLIEDLGMG